MPKLTRVVVSSLCDNCETFPIGKSLQIEHEDEQGSFSVRLCDDCVVKAAKKLMLAKLDDFVWDAVP